MDLKILRVLQENAEYSASASMRSAISCFSITASRR
jgi:hypothetical protein